MKLSVGPVDDKRFARLRDLNAVYDVSGLSSRFTSREDWEKRAAGLRQQILAAAGLVPFPEKTPLNAQVFGRIEREGYTVEKVRFESFPGFFVTGNLYRPTANGLFPGVLNPHGHWKQGRLEHSEDCSIPGRCANFALQGYVAFSYDMIGYADSAVQMSHDLTGRRERLWGISLGGVQLWNGIRALDFLQSLADVDPERIAMTGASGGGTQTFLLSAVDERVKVCAPVNMISAHMQGGCRCENLPNLRIDTDNVEVSSIIAPRPMIMVSCTGDWTKDTPHIEFPAIRGIYELLGAEDQVSCVQMEAGHNYNRDSREAVYSWFGRWLPVKPLHQLVREQAFRPESREDLLVYPDGKLPEGALDRDGLVNLLIDRSESQLSSHRPHDVESLREFRRLYAPVLRSALSLTEPSGLRAEERGQGRSASVTATSLILHEESRGAQIPAMLFDPDDPTSEVAVLAVHAEGMQAFLGDPPQMLESLLQSGRRVMLIDCFGIGEHAGPEGSTERDVDKDFFDTYNRTDTAERIFDIIAAAAYLQQTYGLGAPDMVGLGRAGLWCLLALPFIGGTGRAAIDADGLDTSDDISLLSDLYVPCLRRAGDFRAAQALCEGPLFVHNTRGAFDTSWAEAAYSASGRPDFLRVSEARASDEEIASWLYRGR